jgi:hypothetical protein
LQPEARRRRSSRLITLPPKERNPMSKFAALAANVSDAFSMPITSPLTEAVLKDSDDKEAFISFLSPDSEVGRKIDRAQSLQVMRKMRSGRNLQDDDDLTEQQVDKLVALTAGWHLVDLDGKALDVPFSKDNAKELWTDPAMGWLRRQAWVFVNTAGNFIRRSSTT